MPDAEPFEAGPGCGFHAVFEVIGAVFLVGMRSPAGDRPIGGQQMNVAFCHQAAAALCSSTDFTARTILSSLGRIKFSIVSLYGTEVSSAVSMVTGACKPPNACSATSAAMIAAAEEWRGAWSTSTRRPVFLTESTIVFTSSGARVRGST